MAEPKKKRRWRWILGGLAVFTAFVLVRGAMLTPAEPAPVEPLDVPAFDLDAATQRFARVVRHKTISLEQEHGGDPAAFAAQLETFKEHYPSVHARLKREVVNDYSLVFTWPGSDASLAPVLFTAHHDVVPIESGTEENWTQPPFSGHVDGEYIWGRGAMDDKLGTVGLLEALELLLESRFEPRRTVIVGLGHDEEIGGPNGAQEIARLLESRGVRPWFVLDEGGAVVRGIIPGVDEEVAFVGIAEKGYASLRLTAGGEGGHSSRPPEQTAIGRLSAALARLESSPFPTAISRPTAEMLDALGPHQGFGIRVFLANRWLFDPLIERGMTTQAETAATIRTTTAITMFNAGVADNVLASQASAVVNFRIVPGDTVQSVTDYVRRKIDDEGIEIECFEACWDPSPVSPTDSEAFAIVEQSIRRVFPGVLVVPNLVIGATDSRYYHPLAEQGAYRFLPVRFGPDDRNRYHGTDERISISDLDNAIKLYATVIKTAAT